MKSNSPSITSFFSDDGALSQVIQGFSPRKEQTQMAIEVEKAITAKHTLVVEAGTGTGKTFAYLAPAINAGQKVIISTGTKNLQEQLFYKDIPIIKKALGSSCKTALLKGRANYLCEQRLALYRESREQLNAEQLHELVSVINWSTSTRSGDIGELTALPENSLLFPFITSSVDNCLSKDCPFIESCYLVNARKKAMQADIVVVNHHLFFADMALKDIGFGELIPQADSVIFDEAHQIPDIACNYFGESFSTRQLLDLCHDVEQVYKTELIDVSQLQLAFTRLAKLCKDLREMLPEAQIKGHLSEFSSYADANATLGLLLKSLTFLYDVLKLNVGRCEAADSCFERAAQLLIRSELMADMTVTGISFWFETTRKHVIFHQTPLSIADKFSAYVNSTNASWIFTSATLAIKGSVGHFVEALGLDKYQSLVLPSPFDYATQSLLYVPRYLPETNNEMRAQGLVDIAVPLVNAAKYRCFMLFTSYKIMHQVADLLANSIEGDILIQGQMPKSLLLNQFLTSANSVLLATSSFWEGVDVKGDKLVCVIIDKLPFAAPDEPLLQAKSREIKRLGGDPFIDLQLTKAVISLKQGVGRLIRDASDMGLMVICDSRLVGKEYSPLFLSSLPPMPRTRESVKAVSFLTHITREI